VAMVRPAAGGAKVGRPTANPSAHWGVAKW
jgi:hypothetical protein